MCANNQYMNKLFFPHISEPCFSQQFILRSTHHSLTFPQTPQIRWSCRWPRQEPLSKATLWPLAAAATPTRLSQPVATGCLKTDTCSQVDRISACQISSPLTAASITVRPGTMWAREESCTLTPPSCTWMFTVRMMIYFDSTKDCVHQPSGSKCGILHWATCLRLSMITMNK